MTENHTRRVALVIDVVTATEIDPGFGPTTRGWIAHLVEHLGDRGISAEPVRIDIDGWPQLFG